MAISTLELFREARNDFGFGGTLADVQAALASVDRTPLEAAERMRYQVSLWDEASPLAGQPPAYWRDRGDWPVGGRVFTIHVDGALQYVQPHDPESAGFIPMDSETALARANGIVGSRIEAVVDAQVRDLVLAQLLS